MSESLYILGSDATAAPVADGMLQAPTAPDQTTTTLLKNTANLRYKTHHLGKDASALHREATLLVLHGSASEHAKRGLESLLETLSNVYGLSWSAIARLVGVSVPALRKWRTGAAAP
jgi:DNA-binding transcriptional regulator YiaG